MLMNIRKLLFLIPLGLCLLLTSACSDDIESSEQYLNNLSIQMDLQENGSVEVTELWDLNLKNRGESYRNVYKSFRLDSSKAGNISDFSVYDVDNDIKYPLTEVKDPSKNTNDGLSNICYLYKEGSNVELGLYMPEIKSGKRKFEFKYTVNNLITVYNDVAVLYYQELGPNFSLPVYHMDCNISLPASTDKDLLRAWLHCTADSNLSIDSGESISFVADKIPSNTMVETRVCMPTDLFPSATKIINENQFNNIIQEETKWQSDYENKITRQYVLGIVDVVAGIAVIVLGIFYSITRLKKNARFKLDMPKYIRDIPEGETPGTMAEIFYYYNGGVNKNRQGQVLSSTLLNLACKKYISIENPEKTSRFKKEDIFQIIIHSEEGIEKLSESENLFFTLLSKVASANKSATFTMSDFKKYAQRNYIYVDNTLSEFFELNKKECVNKSYINKNKMDSPLKVLSIAAIVLSVSFLFVSAYLIYLPLSIIISSIFVLCALSRKPRLLIDGERSFLTWKGLESFMLDFSRMKEYSTMELALWEKYLVYATAMGISAKVCNQLKMVYPQINDPVYVDNNYGNSWMYWMLMDKKYNRYGHSNMNFGNVIANQMSTISNSATRLAHPPSSSSGSRGGFGGGGFSGGGGGFGGGGGGVR